MKKHYKLTPRETFDLALSYQEQGQFQAAETLLLALLERGHYELRVRNQLGILYCLTGQHERSIAMFESCLGQSTDKLYAENYIVALRKMEKYPRAIDLLSRLYAEDEDDIDILEGLIWVHLQQQNYQKAIDYCKQGDSRFPQERRFNSSLCTAYFLSGEHQLAQEQGEQCLTKSDVLFTRQFNELDVQLDYKSTRQSLAAPTVADRDKNIIAFSLWGDHPMYLNGAIANAQLAQTIYPEWTCRFYCDEKLPESLVEELKSLGAQVEIMTNVKNNYEKYFWRFFVADDPGVERFLCRDVDSRLSSKERAVVDEWVTSGKSFHIMRDAILHCPLMLAGMWGAISSAMPDMRALYENYYGAAIKKGNDQTFLSLLVWPYAKNDCLIHDSFYHQLFGAKPFPPGEYPDCVSHVGARSV